MGTPTKKGGMHDMKRDEFDAHKNDEEEVLDNHNETKSKFEEFEETFGEGVAMTTFDNISGWDC
jgi:DNA replication protein DnaD